MKIELQEEEVQFINQIMQSVKVNDVTVNLQSLLQVLQKINTPAQEAAPQVHEAQDIVQKVPEPEIM